VGRHATPPQDQVYMKLKFKVQAYQTAAVQAVVDCFEGQSYQGNHSYRIDPGKNGLELDYTGFKNAPLQISPAALLRNIQAVQQRQNLPVSQALVATNVSPINLDIEMETGTGKTYCYIKTIYELHQRYGWSKYIIVVPSIAIREGVSKSLAITAEHFLMAYQKQARFFTYNSKNLTELENFSASAGIHVMVINIQAFNATGADNRRIYEQLDDFGSRRPIDVIASNQPILILDEPQKMEGKKTLDSLAKFHPLMVLRYSATHKTVHNKVHRLDALDAYNQKLVKKIAVRGITVRGLAGTTAYLYLESIEISSKAPVARIEIEVQQGGGIKRMVKRLGRGDNLHDLSNGLEAYRGYVIAQIDAYADTVTFTNGQELRAGDAIGDITEILRRRIQIREAVKAHLEKERSLHWRGIKVLSLFFIDKVDMYRDYSEADEQGPYARIFEEEYNTLVQEYLGELSLDNPAYRQYLTDIPASRTHNGYFSIDKKSKRLTDPSVKARGEDAGLSDDVDAYDLILRDKERLLSLEEHTRFIFSHSALREGWDNPNVFVMCMLKDSNNTISRRQEVGRGLRLAVDQAGDRQDAPETVHAINVLTVVASESYKDFVSHLQSEISASLSARPRQADKAYFEGKTIKTPEGGATTVSSDMAEAIEYYLIQNGYVDRKRNITEKYHTALKLGELAPMEEELRPHAEAIVQLINGVFSDVQLPAVGDDRKPKLNRLNDNFKSKEFQALWQRINHQAIYQVDFDSQEHRPPQPKAGGDTLAIPRPARPAEGQQYGNPIARGNSLPTPPNRHRNPYRQRLLRHPLRLAGQCCHPDPAHARHSAGHPQRCGARHLCQVPAKPGALHHRGRPPDQ
jgi:type III restriction enzyme